MSTCNVPLTVVVSTVAPRTSETNLRGTITRFGYSGIMGALGINLFFIVHVCNFVPPEFLLHQFSKLSLLILFIKSDCIYSPLKLFAHLATLQLLSSSDKSSILVIIDHLTPQGSSILPNRSPETKFATGSLTFAPLATAFSMT